MNGTFEVDFEACDLYHAYKVRKNGQRDESAMIGKACPNAVRKNGQRDESAMIGKACPNAHYYTIYGVLNVYVF